MALITSLTKKFGINHPIMLAPMGGVAGGELAASVSNAGGLGIIGAGYGDIDWLRRELDLLKRKTQKPWGIGFITWTLTQEVFDLAMSYSPHLVMLSFGDVTPWAAQVHTKKIPLFCQVQDLNSAFEVRDKGADFIVAQGSEAGGHGSNHRSTLSLVRGIVDHIPGIPVIAAGGIADGKSLAAVLNMGAQGASIGTRFYASFQSMAHYRLKERIVECSGDDTIRTHVFDVVREIPWPSQYSGRAITNKFVARWHGNENDLKRFLPKNQASFYSAQDAADPTMAVVWAGECIDSITDILDAGDIVRNIGREAEALINS
ncbi:NAD(P)H-dependent flavin oxidoreductase [Methylophaga sp. OBS4]|uniref:NAD(P)H-dependent flavin oxidoreductase n=1 Tax=Methylophaga sp. OBS4 TaxID=2991935 RepID=UPI0022514172|nr:nitronate monooxygenase [Methylophaga sp. OBS4]MCX4186883.1 nitronate monooxygenase [Methylophaga sp. OBS4]